MTGKPVRKKRRRCRIEILEEQIRASGFEVGTALFRGPMFGGFHCIRLLADPERPDSIWIFFNGRMSYIADIRAARRILARRIQRPFGKYRPQ